MLTFSSPGAGVAVPARITGGVDDALRKIAVRPVDGVTSADGVRTLPHSVRGHCKGKRAGPEELGRDISDRRAPCEVAFSRGLPWKRCPVIVERLEDKEFFGLEQALETMRSVLPQERRPLKPAAPRRVAVNPELPRDAA